MRRRKIANRVAEAIATIAALLAVGVLALVVLAVAKRGASELSWTFLTSDLPVPFSPGGGIAPLIVGSAILVGIATAIALPIGVCIALFLEEFAPAWLRSPVQLAIDLMTGLPSVIIGVFIFSLLVYGHAQSGLAGANRTRDRDAAPDHTLDAGGAAARPQRAARGRVRARSEPLANRARDHPAERRSAAS